MINESNCYGTNEIIDSICILVVPRNEVVGAI